MKPLRQITLLSGLALVLASCATKPGTEEAYVPPNYNPSAQTAYGPGPGPGAGSPVEGLWPRTFVNGDTTNLLYEPQVDSWNGKQLVARQAVATQRAGQPQPTFGVVTIEALTLVDKTKNMVSLENIRVTGGDFPAERAHNLEYFRQLSDTFPKELPELPLDRLETSFVAPLPAQTAPQKLNNSPPKFIVSNKPAILVSIDGPPAFRPVPGTELERVLNTRLLVLRDKTGQVYVHMLNGYLQAPSLDGPWTVAAAPPHGASEAEQQAQAAPTPVDLMDGRSDSGTNLPPSLMPSTAPIVYVSTTPAELIVFEGQPDFVPIPETHLLYVANTTANVFKSMDDQQTYVLSSGRWFKAANLQGPWQYVGADHLPRDFATIPDNSPKENVKASVPGTPQATEAVIANSIPQSTKVARTELMPNPQIDGPPRLEPIAGTPLFYVANSGTPTIKVDDQSWYACQNGVWFYASSLNGPWAVAASVPPVIYTIPATSPMHYLTYVQVYGATPDNVYVGYTPGYWGTEVQDGVVVYGTGYYYPPWVGTVWYGWPYTWGFGWGPCWTPWYGWSFTIGFGWGYWYGPYGWWGCHPPHPWWGPYCGWHHGAVAWHGTVSTAHNVYAASSPVGTAARAGAGTAPPTPLYGRSYNSRTGTLAAGQHATIRNAYSATVTRGSTVAGMTPHQTSLANGWRSPRAVSAPLTPRPGFSGYGGYGAGGYNGGHWSGYQGYPHAYGGYPYGAPPGGSPPGAVPNAAGRPGLTGGGGSHGSVSSGGGGGGHSGGGSAGGGGGGHGSGGSHR